MNEKIEQAKIELERLKTTYRIGLRKIDGLLRQAVSQHPDHLRPAKALQAEYGTEFVGTVLAINEQPKPQHNDPQVDPSVPAPVKKAGK